MLIYAACLGMLAADFVLDPTLWRASKGRQLLALTSVAMGATGMVRVKRVLQLLRDGKYMTSRIFRLIRMRVFHRSNLCWHPASTDTPR